MFNCCCSSFLVSDRKLTGLEERCVLIDGTIRRTPVAEIHIETPYYTGMTTAVCMKSPIYDLIVGNIQRVHDDTVSQETLQAVQTRSQAKASKGMTPLVTPDIDFGTEDITKLQAEDESLERARKLAKWKDNTEFQLRQGLVYRIRTNHEGVESKQLAVPKKLRQQVMTLAHAGIMSGHQGPHRT